MKKFISVIVLSVMILSCEKEEKAEVFHIKKEMAFTIELEANWSTGYGWKWENREEVVAVDTTGREYVDFDSSLVGTPGVEKWTFIGKATGRDIIRMVYQRSGDSEQLETREYGVVVEGD